MDRIALRLSDFKDVAGFIDEFCNKYLADESEFCVKVRLIYEELMTNMFKYAVKYNASFVDLDVRKKGNVVEMSFVYDGDEFDPTTYKDERIDESFETKEIGGFGLLLVASLSESFTYKRTDGINRIDVKIA